jgi:hypothetical protein
LTYDFFADESDKVAILTYILEETDLQIFDLYSRLGETVKNYNSLIDITSCFDLKNEVPSAIHFQLWSPRFKGEPNFRKIELNPKYCKGHTFRFSTEGWGLIQLYLGGVTGKILKHSHVGHWNQKGALKSECTSPIKGNVESWDWTAVQRASNQLKYLLDKKLSVKRLGNYGVLPGAAYLEEQGFSLVY